MKAITLHQPWATLVAIGAKKIETRSWNTNYRGLLAIHAGRNTQFVRGIYSFMLFPNFRDAVKDAEKYWRHETLPLGFVLATCDLVDVVQIDARYATSTTRFIVCHGLQWSLETQERAFGNYAVGRYMWLLDDIQILPEPIPAKGSQGFWEWERADV